MKTLGNDERGFTLVELAIVMIIIGLLIGGVLKGQQLVDNAKVTSTLTQIRNYQAAVNGYLDTYGAMPGDMRNALTRLPGCTAADTNCANGNGDGFVTFGGETPVVNPGWNQQSAGADETIQFWKHLSLADLIVGVDTEAATATTDLIWGVTHPESSLRGGFEAYYDTDFSDVGPNSSGLLLRLSNTGLGGTVGTAGLEPATPTQAANIDRKLDDGRPSTGVVFTNGAKTGEDGCKNADEYDEQTDQRNCLVYFALDS